MGCIFVSTVFLALRISGIIYRRTLVIFTKTSILLCVRVFPAMRKVYEIRQLLDREIGPQCKRGNPTERNCTPRNIV